ncbi:MAG: hypothetical protein JW953_17525 [Anaerolineae bacterium]|nr:hypothetical protein [Anaerolineae bacterium]
MKHLNFVMKSLLGLAILMLLAGALVAPAAAAPPTEEEQEYTGLKYVLKWAILRLEAQQDNIDSACAGADLVEEFIEDEKAEGQDTAGLEAALAEARIKLDEAQGFHTTAAQILKEKAGFDDEDNVTDPQQARDTLRSAGQAMREANQALREARQSVREALREYRQSKRDDK